MPGRTPTSAIMCAQCGYDRSGLPDEVALPARCPECGSRETEARWPGWCAVLRLGTGVPLVLGTVGCALPAIILEAVDLNTEPEVLLGLWILMGLFATVSYALVMPIAASSKYARGIWTRNGHPGQVRILLVCWVFTGFALGAIAIGAQLLVELLRLWG
jgi:hypothetical protein